MDIHTVTRRTEALFLPRENTPASLSETLTCEPVVFHHRRRDLVRSSRTSDLSGDRINSQCAFLSTSMCMCSRCAPCCNPRVRKYPAGRRPSSRPSRSRGPLAHVYRQVFMDSRSRIYRYRAVFTRYSGSYSSS